MQIFFILLTKLVWWNHSHFNIAVTNIEHKLDLELKTDTHQYRDLWVSIVSILKKLDIIHIYDI